MVAFQWFWQMPKIKDWTIEVDIPFKMHRRFYDLAFEGSMQQGICVCKAELYLRQLEEVAGEREAPAQQRVRRMDAVSAVWRWARWRRRQKRRKREWRRSQSRASAEDLEEFIESCMAVVGQHLGALVNT